MLGFDFQKHILECSKKAESAPNEEARRIWKRMEEFWRQKSLGPSGPKRTFAELQSIGSPPTAAK